MDFRRIEQPAWGAASHCLCGLETGSRPGRLKRSDNAKAHPAGQGVGYFWAM